MTIAPQAESPLFEEIKPPLDALEAVVEADRFAPAARGTLEEIQRLVDAEWDRLVERCGG